MWKHGAGMWLAVTLAAAAPAADWVSGAKRAPADSVPADAVAFVALDDVRPALGLAIQLAAAGEEKDDALVAKFLRRLAPMLRGRALLVVSMENRVPTLSARVRVDESKRTVADLVTGVFTELVGEGKVRVEAVRGVSQLCAVEGGKPFLFWAVRRGVLCIAGTKGPVERFAHPPDKAVRALSATADYRRLGKHVDWAADVTAFVDLRKLWWKSLDARFLGLGRAGVTPTDFPAWAYHSFALNQFRAAGLSWKATARSGSGRLAVLAPGKHTGLARLLELPNAPPAHLDALPENCLLYGSTGIEPTLVAWVSRFLHDLDPDVGREFDDELAEFNKDLGVDLGRDFLGNLPAMATGVPSTALANPATYTAATLRDPAAFQKCAEALAAYNQTPLQKTQRAGRTFYTVPSTPPLHYTLDGKTLLLSSNVKAVEHMLALRRGKGGPTLARSATFAELRKLLPRECVLLWAVDVRSAATMLGAARLLGGKPRLPKAVLGKALASLQSAPTGLSLGVALRTEPDALVVHVGALGSFFADFSRAALLLWTTAGRGADNAPPKLRN